MQPPAIPRTVIPLSKAPLDKLFIAFFAFALVVCFFVDIINVIAPVGSIVSVLRL